VDQTSGTTTPVDPALHAQDDAQPVAGPSPAEQTGFGSRGRARRRARFLRRARELAYRDVGGLVYNLHRFGQRNDELVLAKLNTLGQIDGQLRALELALGEREPVTVLREAGITACARCAAIHSSEDRFCPNCGLPVARHVDLPIAGPAAAPVPTAAAGPTAAPVPTAAPEPGAAPGPTATPGPGAPGPAMEPAPPGATHAPVPAHAPEPSTGVQSSALSPSPAGEQSTEILRPGAPRR
jgi:hypothetical protein